MFAIAHVIYNELTAREWRKSDLVAAMGYKNLARGLKRLEACLHGEEMSIDVMRRVQGALGIPDGRWQAALQDTRRQQQEEQRRREALAESERRAHFRPHVYVHTSETKPRYLTAAATIGPRLKYLQLDDAVLRLPRPQRIARVAELVRMHYRENLGRCLLFGQITGYHFRISYEETLELDTQGNIIRRQDGQPVDEEMAILHVKHAAGWGGLFEYM